MNNNQFVGEDVDILHAIHEFNGADIESFRQHMLLPSCWSLPKGIESPHNVTLTITQTGTLEVDLNTYSITIENGGGIHIQTGGSLAQTGKLTPPQQEPSSDQLIYHHTDHLSGASVDTNINGSVIALNDYYPFGDSRIEEGEYENDYTYTGKERDEDTDLLYYEARYYNSNIARFLSLDPWAGDLTDPQSLNKYAYVRNNPLKYVDPFGLDAVIFAGENYENEDNPKEFVDKANQRKEQLIEDGYEEEVHVVYAKTPDEFNEALKTIDDIDMIEYYGHGDSSSLFLSTVPYDELTDDQKEKLDSGERRYRYAITNDEHASLEMYKNSSDMSIYDLFTGNKSKDKNLQIHLYSCHAFFGGDWSIGNAFSTHFRTPVYASQGSVSFSGYKPRPSRLPFSGVPFEWRSEVWWGNVTPVVYTPSF
ncbi:RHS repeat-associated core domain-containing protein [Candidatus Peregrinibacteria bacterium]|nr:MAG: RHS repeat-associated core domain-containing protein [Candidatus Peregrinibacteria bacterium]